MQQRQLGPFAVSAIGLGCMNMSHAYGNPPGEEDAAKLLHKALDLGYTHLDTAALYGFGANETLIGKTLKGRRDEYVLASKCGNFRNDQGVQEINNSPDMLRKTCEDSLRRLQTDVIDIYYLHRWDKATPIEDVVGVLAEFVKEGKVRAVGLSEISADTLRKAHAVHPIAALQNEYSLWTRNPEIKALETCRELGVAFVAFSPLGRAFLTGKLRELSQLAPKDIRHNMPRFSAENFPVNLTLLDDYAKIAEDAGCSMAQLALAWLLAKGEDIVPIPGTKDPGHLEENAGAAAVQLDAGIVARLNELINEKTVRGERYNPKAQANVEAEQFA